MKRLVFLSILMGLISSLQAQAPNISCPSNITISVDPGVCDATVTDNLDATSSSYFTRVKQTNGVPPKRTLWGWGQDGVFNGVGGGSDILYTPEQFGTKTNWVTISCNFHCLGILSDGTLWTWGRNRYQFMAGDPEINPPVQIGTANNWVAVSTGESHSLGLRADGTLWAWGSNISGQLGTGGSFVYQNSPVQVGTDTDWAVISAGGNHSLAIKANSSLWSWGGASSGQLGNGSTSGTQNTPGTAGNLASGGYLNWVSISAGQSFSLGVKADGTLWSWGSDSEGRLGNGPGSTNKTFASQVGNATNWATVSAGLWHSIALRSDGSLYTWGYDYWGQLGDGGSNINQSSPVHIGNSTNWRSITGHNVHTLGLQADGSLWAMGNGFYGVLGNGPTSANATTPTQVGTLSNWVEIETGLRSCYGIKNEGYTFPVGVNNMTYQATNALGNTASCSFTVTVIDDEPPTINCQHITLNADPGGTTATSTAALPPLAGDNCTGVTVQQTSGPNPTLPFSLGNTQLSYLATDAHGNSSSCSFTVTVKALEAPTARCKPITVQLDANGGAYFTPIHINNGSFDDDGIADLSLDRNTIDCSGLGKMPGWEEIGGQGISSNAVTGNSLASAPDGTLYLTYRNASIGPNNNVYQKISVQKWDGTNWSFVGGPVINNQIGHRPEIAVAPDGTPYVISQDGSGIGAISVYKWNGNSWITLAGQATLESRDHTLGITIAPDGTPYIAFKDTSSVVGPLGKIAVRKWDGTDWQVVGTPGISQASGEDVSIAAAPDGTIYVSFQDQSQSGKASVLQWEGTQWNAVGGLGLSLAMAWDTKIAISPNGTPYLAYKDLSFRTPSTGDKLTVMVWDGSTWTALGGPGISDGNLSFIRLAISQNERPLVAYSDFSTPSQKLTVLQWTGSSWHAIGGKGVSAASAQFLGFTCSKNGTPYAAFQDYADQYGRTTVLSYQGDNFTTLTATDNNGNEGKCRTWVTVEDNIDPGIQLLGASPFHICQGEVYEDPGTTVSDNCDNGIAIGNPQVVNTAVPGTYTLTYNFSDQSGNAAPTITRTVIVDPTPGPLAQQGCKNCGEIRSTICQYDVAPDLEAYVLANINYEAGAVLNWYADNNGSKGSPLTHAPIVNPTQVSTDYYWIEQQLGDCPGPPILVRSKVKKLFTPDFNLPAIGCTSGQIDLAAWVSDPKNKATGYTFFEVNPAANTQAISIGSVSATGGLVDFGQHVVVNIQPGNQTYWVKSTVPNGCGGVNSSSLSAPVATATLNFINDITINAGDLVNLTFGGQYATHILWVDHSSFNNPAIGIIGTQGLGGIQFIAQNISVTPVSATIRVIPYNGNCAGTYQDFSITVNPGTHTRQGQNSLQLSASMLNLHDVTLKWDIHYEFEVIRFEIEKKRNDSDFEAIGFEDWQGNGSYSFVDQSGMGNTNTYRLKLILPDGRAIWSKVQEVNMDFVDNKRFTVFPNPNSGQFKIKALFPINENYQWQLSDRLGKIVKSGHTQTHMTIVDMGSVSAGMYHLMMISPEGKRYLMKVVKQ